MSKGQSQPPLQQPQSPQLSVVAKGLIADLRNCITTNTTKAQVIGESAYSSHGMIDGRYNSSMSTIESLGARAMMSFLSPEEIQSFVDNIHAAETVHRSFVSNSVDAEKGRLSAAKTEAALKGYVLPLSDGAPYELIKTYDMKGNLTDAEKNIAFAAGGEALLTVSSKNIPPGDDYAKAVQEEYARIISRDHPELEPERLKVLKEYASHGVKKKQGQSLPSQEQEQIREAALETRKEFSKIFSSHKDKMQAAGPNVILEENLHKKFVEEIIQKKFEKQQEYMIDPETRKELDSLITEKIKLLDAGSVNDENMKTLVEKFEKELLEESPRLTVLKAINAIEKESGINVSESQAKRIADKLSPALAALDPEYLRQNAGLINGQIQKEVIGKSMITSNRLGGLYVREGNLDRIANDLYNVHIDQSDKFQISKINEKLFSMNEPQLAEKLTELGVEKAKATRYDVNKISDPDLVRMRRENPEQFDRIVLKKHKVAPNRKEVVEGVIDKAVDKLKTENGVKLTPEKEKHLREKFKEQLTPALSKLDPEYLQGQNDMISNYIQQELYKNRSVGYRFGFDFSVSKENLADIASGITASYQKASIKFEFQTVEQGLRLLPSQAEFEQGLNALGVEKAKAVKFSKSQLSSEELLKMRKENPARFDKVVLGVGKEKAAAKQLGAAPAVAPVQEKTKEVTSSVSPTPPPLLSQRHAPPPKEVTVVESQSKEALSQLGSEGQTVPNKQQNSRPAPPPFPRHIGSKMQEQGGSLRNIKSEGQEVSVASFKKQPELHASSKDQHGLHPSPSPVVRSGTHHSTHDR